jgi:RimJ/RimL family protein N-acetyltransferase
MAKLPVFTTERLILREVTEADAPAYEKNFDDYEVISQLASVVPWPYRFDLYLSVEARTDMVS